MGYLQGVKIVLIYGTFQQQPREHARERERERERRRLHASRTGSQLSSNKTRLSHEISRNSTVVVVVVVVHTYTHARIYFQKSPVVKRRIKSLKRCYFSLD